MTKWISEFLLILGVLTLPMLISVSFVHAGKSVDLSRQIESAWDMNQEEIEKRKKAKEKEVDEVIEDIQHLSEKGLLRPIRRKTLLKAVELIKECHK